MHCEFTDELNPRSWNEPTTDQCVDRLPVSCILDHPHDLTTHHPPITPTSLIHAMQHPPMITPYEPHSISSRPPASHPKLPRPRSRTPLAGVHGMVFTYLPTYPLTHSIAGVHLSLRRWRRFSERGPALVLPTSSTFCIARSLATRSRRQSCLIQIIAVPCHSTIQTSTTVSFVANPPTTTPGDDTIAQTCLRSARRGIAR